MIKFFLSFNLVFLSISLIAQDSIPARHKRHQISLSSGLSKHIIQDDIVSPFIYKGIQAPIRIKYKYTGRHLNHQICAFYDKLELESKITNRSGNFPHYSENINGYFSYDLTHNFFSINRISAYLFMGGKIKSYINFRNHYYTVNSQSSTGEENTSLDFLISVSKNYNTKNDLISLNFNFPLVSYVLVSSMYNPNVSEQYAKVDVEKNLMAQFFKNGDFVLLNKQFEFQSEFSVDKSLNKWLSLGFCYSFHFYRSVKHEDNDPVKYLNNQFLLELMIKF